MALNRGKNAHRADPRSKQADPSRGDMSGRTNYEVTDSRPGGFANHTDTHDPRAKSWHKQSGTSSAGHSLARRGVQSANR